MARTPFALVAPVELDREQDVGGLRAAIGAELGVGRALEIRIVQIDVGEAVAGRGQIDQPRARLQQRGDPVDEHEMAQVVGAELGLEAVGGLALRAGHDAGVGDDDIERLAGRHQRVGAGAHAGQRGQVELDQLQAAAVLGGRLRAPSVAALALSVARRADHLGAVRGQRPGRLHAEPGRDAGHQDALAAEIHALEHFVRRRCRAKWSLLQWSDQVQAFRTYLDVRLIAQRPALALKRLRNVRASAWLSKRSPTISSLLVHSALARSGFSA